VTKLILAIDAGTTGIRTVLYDRSSREVARTYREFTQITPAPGLLEHDPEEIWSVTQRLIYETLAKAGVGPEAVAAIGVTGQRSTVLAWERVSSRPLYNALVWQDVRTQARCQELTALLGRPINPMMGLTRMEWLLQNVSGLREKILKGDAVMGTVDSWLVWKLTGGRAYVTDPSNAVVTGLWSPSTGTWIPEMARLIGLPVEALPEIVPSSAVYGETSPAVLGATVPVAAVCGDQQAAMFGHLCTEPGEGKATYGTSVMVDLNTGHQWVEGKGSYALALWRLNGRDFFMLEGTVITGGATISWVKDLNIINSVEQSAELASSVPDSGGVLFLPALQGLGTPFLEPGVRGAIVGLTRATTRAHLARAVLEGIAFRTRQVVEALRADSPVPAFETLRADGGMAANEFFLQLQADVLGIPVERPATNQATALGIAYLAGLAVGYWSGIDEIRATRIPGKRFLPSENAPALQTRFEQWQAVTNGLRTLMAHKTHTQGADRHVHISF